MLINTAAVIVLTIWALITFSTISTAVATSTGRQVSPTTDKSWKWNRTYLKIIHKLCLKHKKEYFTYRKTVKKYIDLQCVTEETCQFTQGGSWVRAFCVDWYLWLTFNEHLKWQWSTAPSIVNWHLVDTQSTSWSTLSRQLVNSWPSINWINVLTDITWHVCQSKSTQDGQDVNQVSTDCQPRCQSNVHDPELAYIKNCLKIAFSTPQASLLTPYKYCLSRMVPVLVTSSVQLCHCEFTRHKK